LGGLGRAPLRGHAQDPGGRDGLPRFTAVTGAQRSEWLLAEHEVLLLSMRAALIAEALRRVWPKWGPISEGDLTAHLGQRTHVPSR